MKNSPEKEIDQTLEETAIQLNVSKSAVLHAIRRHRLPAAKNDLQWVIKKCDVEKYRQSRFQRNLKFNGKPINDKSNGYYSPLEASKILKCGWHNVYSLLRLGKIRSHRVKKRFLVIHIDDLMEFKSTYKPRKHRVV